MNDFNFDNPQRWTLVPGSTNISAIQYTAGDPAADLGTLRIRFSAGAEYSYDKVPNQLAVDFFEAESKGRFFHANIKPIYSAEKIEPLPTPPEEPILPKTYRERA